ncbi:MAG TPA: hypothetical protein VNL91_09200 [Thermoanaerobaculia bacterium]|nr:hypothetical protein [Thermoanaerobaculia bacterium]
MIPPWGMALAALTVMLWLLWSDSIRRTRTPAVLYAVRAALFLVVSGVLILNLVRYPQSFDRGATAIAIAAAVVGIFGAGYFFRRLTTRRT